MTNLSTTIDAFGDLKADIAEQELRLQAMKDALADLEKGAYEGERDQRHRGPGRTHRLEGDRGQAGTVAPTDRGLYQRHLARLLPRSACRTGKKVAA